MQDLDENDDYMALDYLAPENAIYRTSGPLVTTCTALTTALGARDGSRPLAQLPIVFQPGVAAAAAHPPPIVVHAPAPFPMLPPTPPHSPTPEPEVIVIEDEPAVALVLPSAAPPPSNSMRDIFLAGLKALMPDFTTEIDYSTNQHRLYRLAQSDIFDPGYELGGTLNQLDLYCFCFGCKTAGERAAMDDAHFRCVGYTCIVD